MPDINSAAIALSAFTPFVRRMETIYREASCNCGSCVRDRNREIERYARAVVQALAPFAGDEAAEYSDTLMHEALTETGAPYTIRNAIGTWVNNCLCRSAIEAENREDEFNDFDLSRELADTVARMAMPQEQEPEDDYDGDDGGDNGDGYDDELDGDLYSYSSDVLQVLGKSRPDKELVFGVELEMECTSVRRTMQAIGGARGPDFICKSDGSLDNGAELVTLPFTLDHHRNTFDWPGISRKVIAAGASSGTTSTCGIHVHANKAALSPLQIGKMLVFLNADDNARFVDLIAQRRSNGYARRDSGKKLKDGKWNSENRYDILNVGPRTVEFRLFKGNLRPERILKNLEFCHAVITYCATASMQELDVLWFASFLRKNRGMYPNLCRFLHDAREPRFAGMFNPNKKAPAVAQEEA